jgi:hypothetical protein
MNDGHLLRVHVAGSGNNFAVDLPFLRKISDTIYKNHAVVTRDWIDAALAQKKRDDGAHIDWEEVVSEDFDDIKRADLMIVEVTNQELNQGLQTYLAAQYKKPTLLVARSQVNDRFISGIVNKYISLKTYKTEEELEAIVSKFIKQNAIPEKDLRFNFILDRRIYKYLRDKSYETGKNKSEIIRELLEREIERRG